MDNHTTILGCEGKIVAKRNQIIALSYGSIISQDMFWGNHLVNTNQDGEKEYYVILLSSLN